MRPSFKVLFTLICFTTFSGYCLDSNEQQFSLGDSQSSIANAYLDKAAKVAESIQDENSRHCVVCSLEACKKAIVMDNLYGRKSAYHNLECLYENIDEILAECPDNVLKIEIQKCIGDALKQLSYKEK